MSDRRWLQELSFSADELAQLRESIGRRTSLSEVGRPRPRVRPPGAGQRFRLAVESGKRAVSAILDVPSDPHIEVELPEQQRNSTPGSPLGDRAALGEATGEGAEARTTRVSILLSALEGPRRGGDRDTEELSGDNGAGRGDQPGPADDTASCADEIAVAAQEEGAVAAQEEGAVAAQEEGAAAEGAGSDQHPAALRKRTTAVRGSRPSVREPTAPLAPSGLPKMSAKCAPKDAGGAPAPRPSSPADGDAAASPAPASPFPLAADLAGSSRQQRAGADELEDADSDPDVVIHVVEQAPQPTKRGRRAGASSEQELTPADLQEVAAPPPIPQMVDGSDSPLPKRRTDKVGLPVEQQSPRRETAAGVVTSAGADEAARVERDARPARARQDTPLIPPHPDSTVIPQRAKPTRDGLGEMRSPAAPRLGPAQQAQGRLATDWFEHVFDEDYLRTTSFATNRITCAEVDFLIESLGPSRDNEVLDLGCGVGRHAIELAARGIRVTGIDSSAPFIKHARQGAQSRGVKVAFNQQDLRELDFVEKFEAAFCIGTTFGYFDDETNRKLMHSICRALKPGGRFLIDVVNRDYLIRDLPTRVGWEGDGCVVLEEVAFSFYNSRLTSKRSVVFMEGRHLEQDISIRAYSLHELGKLMHQAGFQVLEVSGHIAHRAVFFGNASRSLIVLAEKRSSK